MELVRKAPMYELLEGLALLVQQNPTGFERMVTSLATGVNLAEQSGFSSAGQTNMLNDLIPLLTAASKPQGTNIRPCARCSRASTRLRPSSRTCRRASRS